MDFNEFLKVAKTTYKGIAKKAQKHIPIYAKKLKETAENYGRMGKDAIDIKLFEARREKHFLKLGVHLYNNKDRSNLKSFLGPMKSTLKEIAEIDKKIKTVKANMKGRTPKKTASAAKGSEARAASGRKTSPKKTSKSRKTKKKK